MLSKTTLHPLKKVSFQSPFQLRWEGCDHPMHSPREKKRGPLGSFTKCHQMSGPSSQLAGVSAQGQGSSPSANIRIHHSWREGTGSLREFGIWLGSPPRLVALLGCEPRHESQGNRTSEGFAGGRSCKRVSASIALQSVTSQAGLQEGRSLSSLPRMSHVLLEKQLFLARALASRILGCQDAGPASNRMKEVAESFGSGSCPRY